MIAGVSDEYRIDAHRPDGSVVRIEKSRHPFPVHPEERECRPGFPKADGA